MTLRRWASETPDRTFLIDADGEHSFGYVAGAVAHLAGRFAGLGLVQGDRVGLWLPNRREFVIAQLACHALGVVAVPLNPRLRRHDLAFALGDCSARLLVVGPATSHLDYLDYAESLRSEGRLPSLDHVLRYEDTGDVAPYGSLDVPVHRPSDPAFIMFTSGTTADPKGVVLTRENTRNAEKIAGGLSPDDVTLLGYPLSAITGCHNGVLASVIAGSALILYGDGELDTAIALSRRYGANHLAVHRQVLLALADADPPAFRKASVFPRPAADVPLYERLGVESVVVGYGMTETCGPAMYGNGLSVAESIGAGCDGWESGGVECRVVGGEIRLRGPQVSPGYWNGPGDYRGITDEDGWLHTGDIGEIRDDGSLHFVERRSETFKSRGFTVSPGEIEDLVRATPGVRDCAVFGLDDVPVAVVETTDATADDLYGVCKEALASYKVPRAILCVPSLPRTRTGKVAKRELLALHGDELRGML